MRSHARSAGLAGDVYGRWGRRAVWHAVVAPDAAAHDGPRAIASSIREQLQRQADAADAATSFEVREADDGYRVSGRDAAGAGVDVVVRQSGELTVTPHEAGRPVTALVEDFRRDRGTDGLEYRAAPWRRHGAWLRFEAAIGLRGDAT